VLSRHIENLVSRIQGEPDKRSQKTRDKNDIGDRHLHMSFAELQRMRLRELQCRLVKSIVDMRIDPRTPVDWEANLKEYSKRKAQKRSGKVIVKAVAESPPTRKSPGGTRL
jgi:hypothetical protein